MVSGLIIKESWCQVNLYYLFKLLDTNTISKNAWHKQEQNNKELNFCCKKEGVPLNFYYFFTLKNDIKSKKLRIN